MGSITYRQEMRRCGKLACSRCRDGPAHGPYWYAYWRDEAGHLCKRYCGKAEPGEASCPARNASDRSKARGRAGLHVRMLGGLEVECNGVPLAAHSWTRPSARRLFALLLLHPEGIDREAAAEALWPDRPPGSAESVLSTSLSAVRSTLSSAGPGSAHWCPPRESCLRVHLGDGDWVDAHELSRAERPDRLDIDTIADIVALYRGELLPEFRYEEWTSGPRELLRSRWHALALHLSSRLAGMGRPAAAIAHLQAVLADDGTQEEAARTLMGLLWGLGRRAEALKVYDRLHHSLEVELSVPPDSASLSLAGQVRRDDSAAPCLAQAAGGVAARLRERIARLGGGRSAVTARKLARLSAYEALALDQLGEPEEALAAVGTGRLAAGDRDFPAELAYLLAANAQIAHHHGRARLARDASERAAQLARRTGRRTLTAWALRLQAQAVQQQGQPERAIALARSSVALCDATGMRGQALRSRRIVALNVWYSGRHVEAEALYRRGLQEAARLSDPEQEGYVLCGLGSALRARGALESAEPCLLDALGLASRLQDHFLILSTEYHLANLWADRADALDATGRGSERIRLEAQRRFEGVIRLAQASHSDSMLAFATVDLAMALMEWGRPEEARPLVQLVRGVLSGPDSSVPAEGWARMAEAELLMSDGDLSAASSLITNAVPLLRRASPAGLAPAHRVAAGIELALGRCDVARTHWASSLAAAAWCGQDIEEVRTRRRMGGGSA